MGVLLVLVLIGVHLDMTARIPSISQAKFDEIAGKAKLGCPISKLLNTDITLDAKLQS